MDKTNIILILLLLFQTSKASQLYIDDDSLMVAFKCERADVFKDLTGAWRKVEGGHEHKNCLKEPIDILKLCKHVYPDKRIINVAQMDYEVSVPHWCLNNDKTCIRHLHSTDPQWRQLYNVNATPWKCLNSSYENKALPVPETCRFDHLSDMKMCASSSQYTNQARQRCEEFHMSLKQQSPLKSCGLDKFVGIEFVCCPENSNNNNYNKENNKENNKEHNNNNNNGFNIIRTNHDDGHDDDNNHHHRDIDHHNFITKNHFSKHHYEDDSDDNDVINYDHHHKHPHKKHHNNHAHQTHQKQLKRGSDVIDAYLKERKAGEGGGGRMSEHELYERAKQQLAAVHKYRLKQLQRSLREAIQRAHQHSDPRQVNELRNTINERFQKMLEAEEVEHSVERLQLSHLHEQLVRKRMDATRETTMKLYLQAVDHPKMAARSPYKVVSALQRHIKSLHKDRLHTIRHYNHTDPSYAETIREQSANHIASLDKELAQALLLLDRLKRKTKEFVFKKIAPSLHAYHSLDASFMVKVEKEDEERFNVDDDESDDEDSDDEEDGRKVKSGESVQETPRVVELRRKNMGGKEWRSEDEDDEYSDDDDEDDDDDDRSMSSSEDADEEEYVENGDDDYFEDENSEDDDENSSEYESEQEKYDDEEVDDYGDDYDEEEDEEDEEEEEEDDRGVNENENDNSDEEEDDDDEDEEEDEEEDDDDQEDEVDDEDDKEEDKSVDTNRNEAKEFEDYRDYDSKDNEKWADEDDDSVAVSKDVDSYDKDSNGDGKNVDKNQFFMKNAQTYSEYGKAGADSFKKDAISMQQNKLHASKKFPTSSHTNFGTAIPLGVTVGTLTVAVVIIVGVLVMQRRGAGAGGSGYAKTANRNELDSLKSSPEEKHLASMQVNGYENPTYKYFERCQASPPAEA